MSPGELVSFIEQHLDLGVTTVDHADIYGDYQCEAAFGEALKRAPHLRSRMEIVSKCGIATRARAENTIGHYITDRDHIVLSAEQSLRNLATDHLDLLLIHRPDPLMDADEVAEAFSRCIIAVKCAILASRTLPPPSSPCCSHVRRLPRHQPCRNFTGASAAAARRYSRSAAATAYSSDGVVLSWRWSPV